MFIFYFGLPWTLCNCLLYLQLLCHKCTSRFFPHSWLISGFVTGATGDTSGSGTTYTSGAPVLLRFTDSYYSIGIFRSCLNILCIILRTIAFFVITLFARWNVTVGMVLRYEKRLIDLIISPRGEFYAFKTRLTRTVLLKCLYQAMKVHVHAIVLTISILPRWLDNDVWIGTNVKLWTI